MAEATSIDPIVVTVDAAVPPEDAFATFIDRFQAWWPAEFSWSGSSVESIGIEPRLGGFCYERGPHGLRLDWGRVTAWDPPGRLAFTWQIGPDRQPEPNPAHASEVEIRFDPAGEGSRVTVEHRGFERHGPKGAGYRTAMAEAGWPKIMDRYVAALERRAEAPWEGLTT